MVRSAVWRTLFVTTTLSYNVAMSAEPSGGRLLGALESAVMEVVWCADRPVTVGEVHERLSARRPLAYTTVMTVMTRLVEKGILQRARRGRAYVYEAALSPDGIRSRAAERLVRRLLSEFRDVAIVQFVEELGRLDPEDLEQLARLAAQRLEEPRSDA